MRAHNDRLSHLNEDELRDEEKKIDRERTTLDCVTADQIVRNQLEAFRLMCQACVFQDGFIVGTDSMQRPRLGSNVEAALGLPDPELQGKGHGVQRPGQQFS